MFATTTLFILVLLINSSNARTFGLRQTDSLSVMREKCAREPNAEECTRIQQQMEDLLRKCKDMVSPVPACGEVQQKYCFIWPRGLYCSWSSGGQVTSPTRPPSGSNDPDWYLIPSDPNELKSRGDYCVAHQAEQKCRNLLSALKVRYDDCAKRPKTDPSCQSFKIALCAAFPKFSPCLNGSAGKKRRVSDLERLLRIRRKFTRSS